MAQRTLVNKQSLIEVPEGIDDAVAAALGNAGFAAWLPLEWQAHLAPGETVLVLGATGFVGQLAVQAAKLQGAGRVIAAGRNAQQLQRAQNLGADAIVNLEASADLPAARKLVGFVNAGQLDVPVERVALRQVEQAWERLSVGVHKRLAIVPE